MLLYSDVEHIKILLATIDTHHRQARRTNLLRTALEVIARTTHFDDFENLKLRQRNLINSENKQIEINPIAEKGINESTGTVNQIIKNTNDKKKSLLATYMKQCLQVSEMKTLISAVTLAKIGIINL